MPSLEDITSEIDTLISANQSTFNTLVERYLDLTMGWELSNFDPNRSVYDLRQHSEWKPFVISKFYAIYQQLLGEQNITPGQAFNTVTATHDNGVNIPKCRPNELPYDLECFIGIINQQWGDRVRRALDLDKEELKTIEIKFEYTGTNPLVPIFFQNRPKDYHQQIANQLVEAHVKLHDWKERNKDSSSTQLSPDSIQEFVQSDFFKILSKHPTLRMLKKNFIYLFFLNNFTKEGQTDVQALVTTFKKLLRENTSEFSYQSFDDFSTYTGTDVKVLELIKAQENAQLLKVQNLYNEYLEKLYRVTNVIITEHNKRLVSLQCNNAFNPLHVHFSMESIEIEVNKATQDDGTFNLLSFQKSFNVELEAQFKRELHYTGTDPLVIDYFNHTNPKDFHQITMNKLLEAHVKTSSEYNGIYNGKSDKDLLPEFLQSEFCKIIDEHPTLKQLSPHEKLKLYRSAFQRNGQYHIPGFIEHMKEALKKAGPLFYHSYDDFSEYTGHDEEFIKEMNAANAKIARKYYNLLIETVHLFRKNYISPDDEVKIYFDHLDSLFVSIDPKLSEKSLYKAFTDNMNQNGTYNLLAFQTALNQCLKENTIVDLDSYTGTNIEVQQKLQAEAAFNAKKIKETVPETTNLQSMVHEVEVKDTTPVHQKTEAATKSTTAHEEVVPYEQKKPPEVVITAIEPAITSVKVEEQLALKPVEDAEIAPTNESQSEELNKDQTLRPTVEQKVSPSPVLSQPSKAPVNMALLGGFISAIGITAVALAFTVFNAASLGLGGLLVLGIGVAGILGGIGLFSAHLNKYKTPRHLEESPNDLNYSPTVSPTFRTFVFFAKT